MKLDLGSFKREEGEKRTFEPAPPGEYFCQVEKVELKDWKGTETLNLQLGYLYPEKLKQKLFTSFWLNEAGQNRLLVLLRHSGLVTEDDINSGKVIDTSSIDWSDALGELVLKCQVGIREYNGKRDNQIEKFFPLSDDEYLALEEFENH